MTDPEVVRLPDGRRAHLWQGGATTGPAVLFFHGCPDTRLAARPGDDAARRLGVRLVAVSRPGYGRSDSAASGHLSVADDTVAVADLLGIDRFAVLGMSVGGPYALACAAVHPQRVTAIGIVAAPALVPALDPPWPRDGLAPDEREFFARLARTPVDECVELMRPDFEEFVARVAPDDPDDEALARRWVGGLPRTTRPWSPGCPTRTSPSRCGSRWAGPTATSGTRRCPSATGSSTPGRSGARPSSGTATSTSRSRFATRTGSRNTSRTRHSWFVSGPVTWARCSTTGTTCSRP